MNTVITAILFGLVAACSFGVSDFFVGKITKMLGPMKASIIVNSYGGLIYSVIFLLFLNHNIEWNASGLWYAVIGSLFLGLAQVTFFRAMKHGPIGLVSSIASTYPLISLLLGAVFFAAHLSLTKIAGVLLVVGGVVVASGLVKAGSTKKHIGNGPLIALVPALGWGTGLVFVAQSLAHMDWRATVLIELLVTPLVLLLMAPFVKGGEVVSIKAYGKN